MADHTIAKELLAANRANLTKAREAKQIEADKLQADLDLRLSELARIDLGIESIDRAVEALGGIDGRS